MVHCNTTSCMVYCNSFPKLDGRSWFSILKLHFGGVILKRVISWNSWVLTFNAGISWVAWQARWAARITLVSRGILTKMRHQDCWDSINAEPRTKPALELSWIKNVSLSVSIYSAYIYIHMYRYTWHWHIYVYIYICIQRVPGNSGAEVSILKPIRLKTGMLNNPVWVAETMISWYFRHLTSPLDISGSWFFVEISFASLPSSSHPLSLLLSPSLSSSQLVSALSQLYLSSYQLFSVSALCSSSRFFCAKHKNSSAPTYI